MAFHGSRIWAWTCMCNTLACSPMPMYATICSTARNLQSNGYLFNQMNGIAAGCGKASASVGPYPNGSSRCQRRARSSTRMTSPPSGAVSCICAARPNIVPAPAIGPAIGPCSEAPWCRRGKQVLYEYDRAIPLYHKGQAGQHGIVGKCNCICAHTLSGCAHTTYAERYRLSADRKDIVFALPCIIQELRLPLACAHYLPHQRIASSYFCMCFYMSYTRGMLCCYGHVNKRVP